MLIIYYTMPKQVNKKKKNQSASSIVKKLLKSTFLLYFVFIVVLIDILCLWASRDNESVFLFIILAFIIYIQEKNMIIVLGVPFVIVNILIVLRKLFRKSKNEGFDDKFKDFAMNYVKDNEKEIDAFKFEDISGHGSLYDMTRFIIDDDEKLPDENDDDDKKLPDENLYDFLDNVSNDKSLDSNDEQVKFVKQMFRTYLKLLKTNDSSNEDDE